MKATPVLVSAGAVLTAGAAAIGILGSLARHQEGIEHLEERLSALELLAVVDAGSGDAARLADQAAELEARLTRLEMVPAREPVAAEAVSGRASELAVLDARAAQAETYEAESDAELRAEMEELLELFGEGFDWEGDSDKLQRFYELAHSTDFIDDKIAGLEAGVESAPGNLDGRMQLADTYVAKLMTIQGPEQGLWGMKAEQQWRAVVSLDENHWESTFNLGNNFAYYPDVMGKTDDAIAFLERAREIQEQSTQSDQHVQTYLSLARMHQRKGERDQAREVLVTGLGYHPGNAGLEAALASLD